MNAIKTLLTEHIDIWTAADTEKKSGRGRSAANAASVYGIRKLRELILGLAVSGKLLAQENKWRNLKLSDLGVWAIGSGFPTSEQGSQIDEILFVKVSDMNLVGNEKFIISANNTITTDTAKRIKINVHSAGTVIFPKIGGAIATNKRRILTRETAIDNNCLGLTPKPGVSTDWLYLLLSSIDLSKYQAGTSVPALAQGVLQDIPVMLPDENEQLKIVAKVDELMALCDQLESQHNNAAAAHEKLVSHLLGTLTQSQGAADFSANWQRIAAHFDTLFTTETSIDSFKQTLLQFAYTGKLSGSDISSWNEVALSEITMAVVDIDHKMPKAVNEGVIFLSAKDLKDDGTLDFSQPKYISRDDFKRLSRRIVPRRGDIIYSRIGARLGKARLVAVDTEFLVSYSCCVIRPNEQLVSKEFLVKFLDSRLALDQAHLGKQSIGVPDLGLGVIKGFKIPLPTLVEQTCIVAKVDELMALCEQLKSRLTEANQLQQKLADVLVEQAVA